MGMDKEEYKKFYTEVYRHSLAHILAKAVIEIFGKENVQYAIGPQIADGFYYDFLLPRNLVNEDFKELYYSGNRIPERKCNISFLELHMISTHAARSFTIKIKPLVGIAICSHRCSRKA